MAGKSTAPVILLYLKSFPDSCINEITANTGIKLSTARVMLRNLLKHGYIEKDKDDICVVGVRSSGTTYRQVRQLNTYRVKE